jgi:glycyl-tRNA synthetase beta chain
METASLLLEIGVEELPASYVDAALAALPEIVRKKLADARLTHGDVKSLGTPRRLSVLVHGLATRQLDLDEEVVGPPEAAAFKDGKPTKAAEAFAAKLGADVASLTVVERAAGPKQKAGRYVVGRRAEKGRPAAELLGKALAEVCEKIPFKKSMRWADLDQAFGRPVQWIVALLGQERVDVRFAGVTSGRASRGHRFLAPGSFDVTSAESYVADLRSRHVLVDRDERAKTMMERVAAAAREAGGTYDKEPMLVDENASLVEEPHVVTGSFDEAFLALPAAVIRAVARGHQRYFSVQTDDTGDTLLPRYLAVANTANRPDLIARGHDRTMRARLADARFFFEEDKKVPLEDRVEKTAGIVFHNRLGTVREKVTRMEHLASALAGKLGLAEDVRKKVARAAHLSKLDLVSLMVGELPELQGHMGRAYALHAGEDARVADALRDHYKPVGAGDAPPSDEVAAVVALADRLDSLVGCFAVGLAPTGAADPYALRRACIAVLRILLEAKGGAWAKLAFGDLCASAYELFAGKKLDLSKDDAIAKISEFAAERLRGLIASATSAPVADAIMDAEAASAIAHPVYALARARALQAVVDGKQPWLEKAKTVSKRLSGIAKEAKPVLHGADAFTGSAKKDDAAIVKLVKDADAVTGSLTDEAAVRRALEATEGIATELDRIFVETLINDPQDPKTPARLEILAYGARCMLRIADFTRLM